MKRVFNKKNLLFSITAVCLVGLIGIGASYAYYLANFSVSNPENANNNLTTTSTTDVVMDMQGKYAPSNTVPGFKGVKEVVVRGLGEKNSIPSEASIQITPDLGVFSGDVTWKLYKSSTAVTCTSNIHTEGQLYDDATCNIPTDAELVLEGGAEKSYLNITVYPSTETKYYLVVEYANDGDQSSQMGQTFNIDIGLVGKVKDPIDNIIAQLDTSGKCPTVNDDGSVNVTVGEATNGYLCKAKDAYGDSYYYRGNVTNNYVKFGKWSKDIPDVVRGFYSATSTSYKEYSTVKECQSASSYNVNCTVISSKANKDMYWRIVRINGDGTVRVIYDGTSAYANGESSSDRQIGTSEYNYYWKKDNVKESTDSDIYFDNAGVGYMYGNRDGIVESATQYSTSSYTNTSTYYIAKEYTYNASTDKFTLKDPIGVLGSAMTSDYVGYYTFNTTGPNVSYRQVYKITSVTAGSSSASVGYKYVTYGTTSKEKAQTNTNDSTIKEYLDNWYKTNIVGTTNEQYLADNIFCNDRSISSNKPSSRYNNLGYGTNATAYRWYYFADSSYNNKMMLTCPQQNDAFTVSDTTNGNGALTYPVGLLSTDEIVLAGGWSTINTGYYLYSGQTWWASSPYDFTGSGVGVCDVNSYGYAGDSFRVNYSYGGVRPVFNLKAEVLAQGTGTASDPYRLS